MKNTVTTYLKNLQNEICSALEEIDGHSAFASDIWERQDIADAYGGGGETRVIKNGAIFEQGGVNFSEVYGTMPADLAGKLVGEAKALPFFATGVSLVLHPFSPMVPTVHANYRYLEVGDKKWFGGGADLTPYYLFEEDAIHFHKTMKDYCDKTDNSYYPKFKKECDEYFFLPHRGEARGIGGIFFDYLGKDDPDSLPKYHSFWSEVSKGFIPAYIPIVDKRRSLTFTSAQKEFQLYRRGRYVEFNLIYDRGTLFGLRTGGRTESILMSLPPEVKWSYNKEWPTESSEAALVELLKNPRMWI